MTRPPPRVLAFAALATFAALQWARMLEPAASGRMVVPILAAIATAVALPRAERAPRRGARIAITAATSVLLVAIAALAAGIPLALLDPRAWNDLFAGVGQGIEALPSMRIPYRGVEEWSRATLLLLGNLLLALAAVVAFLPRRGRAPGHPVAAAVVLGVLFGIPSVSLETGPQYLAGLAFAGLLVAFLRVERVRREAASWAVASGAVALLVGLALAPRVDADRPLIDYEQIARDVSHTGGMRFNWSQTYGPLNWPRTGRELLRIKARRASYWKATNLTEFDGVRWQQDDTGATPRVDPSEVPGVHTDWTQRIRVTLRGLRTKQVIAAGTTLSVDESPREIEEVAPGLFATSGDWLTSGQAYRAQVYVPTPGRRALDTAPTAYPDSMQAYLSMLLPPAVGGPASRLADRDRASFFRRDQTAARVQFPAWGTADTPSAWMPGSPIQDDATGMLEQSRYARTYALAQRLKAESATPAQYARRIMAYLSSGFGYTETPNPSAVPLDTFLFRDKAGYCQQFSGAMALLLRMGGVPARVAAGFSPGTRDDRRGEYVVRDVDAHAWVEAYFPTIGWVTFDPTPAESPARGRDAERQSSAATDSGSDRSSTTPAGVGLLGRSHTGGGTAATGGGAPGWVLPVAIAGGLLLVAIAGALVVARRRPEEDAGAAAVDELSRALRRSGRRLAPDTTLHTLTARFAGTPAEGYLRQLADSRYGPRGRPPSRSQRAGLRRALASGLGPIGRVRAWWALPPSLRQRRPSDERSSGADREPPPSRL
jgi:protein-glutamine gamma-glutamyltransferase